MLAWLSGTTLDIIGLAGFGYDFNAIASESSHGEGAGEQNELLSAFQTIFGAATQRSLIHAFTLLFPMLRLLVSYFILSVSSYTCAKILVTLANRTKPQAQTCYGHHEADWHPASG
jgi:hypothetical protein